MENPSAVNAPGNAFAICLLSPHSRKADQPKVIPVPLKACPLPCKTKPMHQIGLSSAAEVELFIGYLQLFKDGANIPLNM
jgi:hypothetical protein